MEFYKILEGIMLDKKLKIPDVARKCGLADSTVRGIMARKNKTVSLDVAFKLSEGLKISLEKLNGMQEKEEEMFLSEDETEMIVKFRKLSPELKGFIVQSISIAGTMYDYERQALSARSELA